MGKKRKLTLKRVFIIIFLGIFFILLRFVFLKYASIGLISMNNRLVKSKSMVFEKVNNYKNKLEYIHNISKIIEENNKKNEEIELLKAKNIEYENLVRENRELRENLELKTSSTSEYIVANTILIESLLQENTLYIDKGSNDGIEQYLPVLLNGNVIGRINRVNKDYSEVQLLSNPDFKMSVDINGHIQGILRGKGNSEFVINNFNDESVDKINLFNIKTSGISEIYPKGLSIGKFNVLNKKSLIENKTLILKLNFDLSKVSTVVVYKYDKTKINLINRIVEERSDME